MKARLVSGVVNIYNIRTIFLFGHLSNIEVDEEYVGGAYPHGFSKDKIYTTEGPGKYKISNLLTKTLITQNHYPLMK